MNNPTATIEELKATLDAWIPKYIRQVVELRSGNKLTAERYNELMNLLITQGDDTIELAQVVKQYVELLVDGLSNNFVDTTDALTQAFNTTTANVTAIAEGAVASVTQYKAIMDTNMEQFKSTVNTAVNNMASDIDSFKTSITESFNATDAKSDNAVETANQLVRVMEDYRVDLSTTIEETFTAIRNSLSLQVTDEVATEAQKIQELLTANLNTAFNNLSAEVTAVADSAVQIANGAVEDVVAYKASMDARLEEALKEVEDSLTAAEDVIKSAAEIYDKIDEIDAAVKSFEGRVEAVENSIESVKDGTTPVGNANLLSGLTAEQVGASGARNLIPYPYYESSVNKAGIEWVVNSDGTVTATGTSTASPNVFICRSRSESKGLILAAGTYTVSGCPNGGSVQTYSIRIAKTQNGSFYEIGGDFGNGVTFTLEESTQIQIQLTIGNGATVENLTFRPMLELGSVTHDFVPYHFGGAEDAKTLDGHGAEYFAKSGFGLGESANIVNSWDEATLPGFYVSKGNAPTTDYSHGVVFSNSEALITQIVSPRPLDSNAILSVVYFRTRNNSGTWSAWKEIATTADLSNYLPLTGGTLANSNGVPLILKGREERSLVEFITSQAERLGYIGFEGASNPVVFGNNGQKAGDILHTGNMADHVLPLTGGEIDGNLVVGSTKVEGYASKIKNAYRVITQWLMSNGQYVLYDDTNNKNIITSMPDGTNTFNGTASGNVPSNGSGVLKDLSLKNGNQGFGRVYKNNSDTADYGTHLEDHDVNGRKAYIRVNASTNVVDFVKTDNINYPLLHTGNFTDYAAEVEEGTFDLTIGGVTLSGYKYVKIGKFVYLYGSYSYQGETVVSIAAPTSLSGLPFPIRTGHCSYIYFGGAGTYPFNHDKAANNFVYAAGTTSITLMSSTHTITRGGVFYLHAMYITD